MDINDVRDEINKNQRMPDWLKARMLGMLNDDNYARYLVSILEKENERKKDEMRNGPTSEAERLLGLWSSKPPNERTEFVVAAGARIERAMPVLNMMDPEKAKTFIKELEMLRELDRIGADAFSKKYNIYRV